jgi:soluble P-type ATPase
MKLYKLSLALFLGLGAMATTSCEDKLDVTNPNQQTTGTFGFNADDLEECVIAAYNHIRMEGSSARVGYTLDVTRGDEVWNSSQVWYMPFDDMNDPVSDEISMWPWREAYYTINVCNFILSRTTGDDASLSESMKRIKGQALFLRGYSYYTLAGYYQNPALITDYANYSSLDGLYGKNSTYDDVLDQVEYIVAHGISSKIGEKHIVIGSYHFVFEDENATIPEGKKEIFEQLPEQYSHLYMAIDGVLVAVICIEDPLRPEAVEVIAKLKKLGISKVVMMTGDSDRVASAIAKKVGVDEYHSEVLPEDKASFVEAEKNAGRKVIMVGDGINDSPALSAADVGIAISDGAEIAREIADVTVGADDLHELVTLKKISNGLMERIHRNYRLIVGINTSLIVLGVAGAFPPTTSALLHNTSTLLISLKSMNNLLDEKEEVTEENVAEAFA